MKRINLAALLFLMSVFVIASMALVGPVPAQSALEDLLRKIEGRKYVCRYDQNTRDEVTITGNRLRWDRYNTFRGQNHVDSTLEYPITGYRTLARWYDSPSLAEWTIAEDGETITFRLMNRLGNVGDQCVFLYQR